MVSRFERFEDSTADPREPGSRASERTETASQPKGRPDGRRRKRVSARAIEHWATRHLERYATSAANLRRVLARRIERIEREQDERFPEAEVWIDEAIEGLVERGFLDDRRYALSLIERLRARGASARRIEHHLAAKGISRDVTRTLLRERSNEKDDEREAAIRYARRRRLGPFRSDPSERGPARERDLAALGRAGFSYETAARVIEAASAEALDSRGSVDS